MTAVLPLRGKFIRGGFTMENTSTTPVNRTYKATVFTLLFEDRNNLLELYNAMSGKHYEDPDLLEVNTLKNAVYMSIKNDVSFIIDGSLSLYEHQSTYSPNLPLRFLLYISTLYSGMTRNENLYGTRAVKIPTPNFVIFYNGEEERPEQEILRLSDMYTVEEKEKNLELKALLLNIKGEHNAALKQACRTLREYAVFTDKMRGYAGQMEIEEAADRAIDECIRENVLRDFLQKHRAEVKKVSIFEYDQEKHLRMEREEAWQDGRNAGLAEGKAAGLAEGKVAGLTEAVLKMHKKGFSISKIAELLEEEDSMIAEIIEQAKS